MRTLIAFLFCATTALAQEEPAPAPNIPETPISRAARQAAAISLSVPLTTEQAQLMIGLINAEIERSCLRGDCMRAARTFGPITESIINSARQAAQ